MIYPRNDASSLNSQRVSSWDRSRVETGRLPKHNGNQPISTLTRELPAGAYSTPDSELTSKAKTESTLTRRTTEQNRLLWALLTDISEQVVWYGQKLTKDEWKDVLTAGLRKTKIVPGIEGGFVMVGLHTSKMTIAEMTELIELGLAFGTQQGVTFSE